MSKEPVRRSVLKVRKYLLWGFVLLIFITALLLVLMSAFSWYADMFMAYTLGILSVYIFIGLKRAVSYIKG